MRIVSAEVRESHPRLIIAFILDESGSMKDVLGQTIEAYNSYVEGQQQTELARREGQVFFVLTKFDSDVKVVHGAKEIHTIQKLSENVYNPTNGWTALNDAIGVTIESVDSAISDWEEKPNVLCVILTDGKENRSQRFSESLIARMIAERKKQGWTFVFLGSDPYTRIASRSYGISEGNTLHYKAKDVRGAMRRLSLSTDTYCCALDSDDHRDGCSVENFFEE